MRIIKDQYASYVTCIYQKIEAKKIKVSDLKVHLSNLLSTDDFNDAKTVEDLFSLLRGKTSFLDYRVYESLRQKFLHKEKKDKLLQYSQRLVDYVNKHRISEFLQINPGLKEHTSGSKLTLKFGGIEETDRLAKVLDAQQALANALSMQTSGLRLFDIKRGCVVVTFLVPHHIASTLFPHGLVFTQEQMAQLRILFVKWITFNDEKMDILDGVHKPKVQDVSGKYVSSHSMVTCNCWYYTIPLTLGCEKCQCMPCNTMSYNTGRFFFLIMGGSKFYRDTELYVYRISSISSHGF